MSSPASHTVGARRTTFASIRTRHQRISLRSGPMSRAAGFQRPDAPTDRRVGCRALYKAQYGTTFDNLTGTTALGDLPEATAGGRPPKAEASACESIRDECGRQPPR